MTSSSDLPQIILASGSPRRRELLESLGIPFEVKHPTVDEKALNVSLYSPIEQALELAVYKGVSIAKEFPNSLVIAADTIVVVGDIVLGKPEDREEAFKMLSLIQGQTHTVCSAIAVFCQHKTASKALETVVTMRPLSPQQVWQYIDTNEPMDKAGAYAIQGYGSVLISGIEGCYFNVVGMSMSLLEDLCQELGFSLAFTPAVTACD